MTNIVVSHSSLYICLILYGELGLFGCAKIIEISVILSIPPVALVHIGGHASSKFI